MRDKYWDDQSVDDAGLLGLSMSLDMSGGAASMADAIASLKVAIDSNPVPSFDIVDVSVSRADVSKMTTVTLNNDASTGARIFYIGVDGDNANDGTRDNPFASIEAIAKDLRAGDTVYYLEGTYQNASYKAMVDDGNGNLVRDIWKDDRDAVIRLNDVNGTDDAPITIAAEPGAKVILQYDGAGAIIARGSSHIVFEGFEIEGPNTTVTKEDAAAAQYLYRIATSEDADGNPVYEYFYRDPEEILDKKISDIIDEYGETIDQSGSGKPVLFNAPAISLPNGSHNIVIQNNIIHDSAAHAVSGHGGNDYISVIGNTAYNNN